MQVRLGLDEMQRACANIKGCGDHNADPLRRGQEPHMNHTDFLELHANYATAMRASFSEMEKTATMLEECIAEPLSFK